MSHPDDPPQDPAGRGDWSGDSGTFDRGFAGAAGAHIDGDTLALVALDEPAGDAVDAHIAGCPACQAEVRSLAEVVMLGRSLDASTDLLSPPHAVWERIAADLGMDPALVSSPPVSAKPPVTTKPFVGTAESARSDQPARTDESARAGGAGGPVADAHVVNLADRRDRPSSDSQARSTRSRVGRGLLVAAAVGGILAGVGITLGWEALDGPAVVASAPLTPVGGNTGDGEAELVGADTKRELKVQLDVDPPPGTYFQVWLMSPDATRMVPVGVLENGDGFWRVPAGLDVTEFPLVDVSVEAFDGNSAHSGDSLVRGSLSSA